MKVQFSNEFLCNFKEESFIYETKYPKFVLC